MTRREREEIEFTISTACYLSGMRVSENMSRYSLTVKLFFRSNPIVFYNTTLAGSLELWMNHMPSHYQLLRRSTHGTQNL